MAKEAERLLAGSGWLPEPLRLPDAEAAVAEPATSEDLPAFLDDNEGASARSEEHTSELQSLMRISYAVFCLKKKKIENRKKLQEMKDYKAPTQQCHTPKQVHL